MCRNIKTLHNFAPPATDEEIRASSLQFVRKLSGSTKPSKITKGSPRYYSTTSEMAGHNNRGFCPECGSRLFGGASETGQGIAASSLDDPSLFDPQVDVWASEAQAWDPMDPKLPKFQK